MGASSRRRWARRHGGALPPAALPVQALSRPGRSLAAPRVDGPGRIDLHMHSDRSDGRFPPEEVLARAARGKLDLVAVCDHDLPNVIPAGVHSVDGHDVRVVAAAEVSGTHADRELHLLVYFPGHMPDDFVAWLRGRAQERADRYSAGAANLGIAEVPPPDADARAGLRSLTRHHLYRAMKDAGHAPDARAAFARLADAVPRISLSFVDAIRAARAAGGLTVWAHPSLTDAQAWAGIFAAAGLQGLEGVRPQLDRRTRNGLKTVADAHGLMLTGGSDWHGWGGEGELGTFAVTGERARAFVDALDAA
jgi:predicted metal-dependent phosphoesterase TrpH